MLEFLKPLSLVFRIAQEYNMEELFRSQLLDLIDINQGNGTIFQRRQSVEPSTLFF